MRPTVQDIAELEAELARLDEHVQSIGHSYGVAMRKRAEAMNALHAARSKRRDSTPDRAATAKYYADFASEAARTHWNALESGEAS